jgi:uncharacterized protein YyaL (SSP411 family)
MSQPDGRLYRSYKDGQARFNAYLEDYAALMRGLIALYEAPSICAGWARPTRLTQLMFAQFHDAATVVSSRPGVDHERWWCGARISSTMPFPAAMRWRRRALLRLAVLLDKPAYRHEAGRIC